jgi:hypothetical protein
MLLLSAEDTPTEAVLAHTCTGVLLVHSVSDTICCSDFLPKRPAGLRGYDVLPRTTV